MTEDSPYWPEVSSTRIHGPDGRVIDPGQYVPRSWSRDYVDSLIRDGVVSVPLTPTPPAAPQPDPTVVAMAQAHVDRSREAKK